MGDSWELATPELRQGMSRTDWASGSIPVVPYPADAIAEVRWHLDYSTTDHRDESRVLPEARRRRQPAGLRHRAGEHRHVRGAEVARSSWSPSGGVQLAAAGPGSTPAEVRSSQSSIRAIWLFVPVGLIVGSMLALILWLSLRGWIRASRADRAYQKS